MKFWAIAYQFQEEVFYDFKTEEDTTNLTETCFLPTKSLAEASIAEELSANDYVPVEIELETLQKDGTYSYTRGRVDRWDEELEFC
ncbi:hypothetical protein [Bacillus toyonensis]|uniref:hypothetical protein n=1 Tax=Bacillus toyonensis TaxID=155322 RepID=UPI002E1F0495|nr:hypothetical protein [Bacillus toyonensis]